MDNNERVVQQSVGMRLGMIDQLTDEARERGESISALVRNGVDIYLNAVLPGLSSITTDHHGTMLGHVRVALSEYVKEHYPDAMP